MFSIFFIIQFSSVAQLCLTLYNPMDCSTPGLPILHYHPEFVQTHVHWVGDTIQPSHALLPLSLLPSIFPSIRVSVKFSHSVLSDSLWPHELQHARPPCLSPTAWVGALSQWCHPTISFSVVPFFSCPQSFPTSGSFQMSQLFASGGQNTGVSASTLVLPMNTQDWSPLGRTGWISLQSKGLSRVFSNTTVQKHQFFSPQLHRDNLKPRYNLK